jgi:phytoene dehydrogenase-like protein
MKKSIQIIGSGFSSLSAACYLAKSGYKVSIFEKNSKVGGRAGQLKKEGFTFDIGPLGIGCQTFSIASSKTLGKRLLITT